MIWKSPFSTRRLHFDVFVLISAIVPSSDMGFAETDSVSDVYKIVESMDHSFLDFYRKMCFPK